MRNRAVRRRQELTIPAVQTLSHRENVSLEIFLLTVAEVAAMLHVSPKTIYMWCDLRIIPHIRLNGAIRFDLAEIEQWLLTCKKAPVSGYSAAGSHRKVGKQ